MTQSSSVESASSDWLDISPELLKAGGFDDRAALAAALTQRVSEKVATGKFRHEDVRYIQKLSLAIKDPQLSVSNEALESLRRLCQLWEVNLRPPIQITSHRKFVGPVIVAVKRLLYPIVHFFMKESMRKQRDFNAAVVQHLIEFGQGDKR